MHHHEWRHNDKQRHHSLDRVDEVEKRMDNLLIAMKAIPAGV
jgi:hypothetical protein